MNSVRSVQWLLVAAIAAFAGLPMVAGAAPAGSPSRVEGVVATSDAASITVALQNNDRVRVTTTSETTIILRASAHLVDIKPNDLVAVTSRRETDGSLTALLINIAPPEFKDRFRQVQFVMESGNMMTNAVVFQNVRKIEGRTLYLRMPDGPSVINVPAAADVFRLAIVKTADLKPGMRVVVRGTSNPDGSVAATGITADALPK